MSDLTRSVSIYTLTESDTGRIRYVGITTKPLQIRRGQHLKEARSGKQRRKDKWLRAVLARGAEPLIEQIDEADEDSWAVAETSWIIYLRDYVGLDLVNGTDGGQGVVNPSAEERARRAEVSRRTFTGRPSPLRGRTMPEEQRVKIKQSMSGKTDPDEVREHKRAAALMREQNRRARSGELCNCSRCAGIATPRRTASAAAAEVWADPEYRARMLPALAAQSSDAGVKGSHNRWHAARGVVSSACKFCE